MSIINVHTYLTSTYLSEAFIHGAQYISHAVSMLAYNILPLIAASIWLSLTGLGVAVVMHAKLPLTKSMQTGLHVHSSLMLSMSTICFSLFGMAMRLTVHTVTNLHCILTIAITYTFVANTHWISACLLALHAPTCLEQLLEGFEATLQHGIHALIKKQKRNMFAHPKIRYSLYWKRVRNRTRRMRRHLLYRYLRTLCQLLTYVQHVKLQHRHYTNAYDEETQNWCDDNTTHTPHARTRTNHANNPKYTTHLDPEPNATAEKRRFVKL